MEIEKIIEWVRTHLTKTEDKAALRTRFELVTAIAGEVTFAVYRALVFELRGKEFKTNADTLTESGPIGIDALLIDTATALGVPYFFEYFQFPKVPPALVNPVGEPWPAKGVGCYMVGNKGLGGSEIFEGMEWRDKRGRFVAERRYGWWPYWVWVKVSD